MSHNYCQIIFVDLYVIIMTPIVQIVKMMNIVILASTKRVLCLLVAIESDHSLNLSEPLSGQW